jgi:hypothetical protein
VPKFLSDLDLLQVVRHKARFLITRVEPIGPLEGTKVYAKVWIGNHSFPIEITMGEKVHPCLAFPSSLLNESQTPLSKESTPESV